MLLKSRDWKGLVSKYGTQGAAQLVESLLERTVNGEPGGITHSDISLHAIIEGTIDGGREFINAMNPGTGENSVHAEAIDAVDTTAFSTITNAVIGSRVMVQRNNKALVLQAMIPHEGTRLDGEMIPGAQQVGDNFEPIPELNAYPHYTIEEDYVETPKGAKRGRILSISREAVFFDRFNLVMRSADNVGSMLYVNKEKRIADVIIGFTNNHKRQGTTYNTYLTSGKWVNDISNPATSLDNLDIAENLLDEMVDFNNGESIDISATSILGSKRRANMWNTILKAAQVRTNTSGAGTFQSIAPNPVSGDYNFTASKYLEKQIVARGLATAEQAKDWWFLGDFFKAFTYQENWPVTVTRAPRNNHDEFNNDIVASFRCSERGVAFANDPQQVERNKH